MPEFPQTTEIPTGLTDGPCGPVYRWLAENGITEWLPENTTLIIDSTVRSITYPSFTWVDDKRGYNAEYLADPVRPGDDHGQPIAPRLVRLEVPLTDEVREAAKASADAGLGQMRFIER